MTNPEPASVQARAFERCRAVLPSWRDHAPRDFEFDEPKGFSSFTMGIRARPGIDVEPDAVLYRHLEGKDNAILEPAEERRVFLLLGEHGIAPRCLHVDDTCRIEEFYRGRTLTADDVFDPAMQRGVAAELHRLHGLDPAGLPRATFFELLVERWGPLVERVLVQERDQFPPDERALCEGLLQLLEPATLARVRRCLPPADRDEPVFCHNDTYHGNTFLRADGRVRLLDFEFSCRNHRVFDFANFFAETAMVHGLPEPPHFRIRGARHTDADLVSFVDAYLDQEPTGDPAARRARRDELVAQTRRAIPASDFMYAMAAVPLAVEPIQRIRFLPYAAARFDRFLRTTT